MGRGSSSRRGVGFGSRSLALGMALATVVSIRPAAGDPGDIFSVSAPTLTGDQPRAAALMDGDSSVATKTGAAQYAYPIEVAPGRGIKPSLALSYSSQAPIYGTVAAGWALNLPSVFQDTSRGRLAYGLGADRRSAAPSYTSSLAGGRPLIETTEARAGDVLQTFRAASDGSFSRYQRVDPSTGYFWRVLATSGTTYFFGDVAHNGGCTNISEQNAPLTREVDGFGNEVGYFYEPGADGECRIQTITWGQNASAGLPPLNQVGFSYAPIATCASTPIGALTSYRTGTKIVTGASQLTSITATAGLTFTPSSSVVHTRVITLAYDTESARCDAPHAAYRALASIQESAWGVDSPRVDLPPVTFDYGSASLTWQAQAPRTVPPWTPTAFGGNGHTAFNLSWGYRFNSSKWPTVEAMTLDLDGDGLPDRLTVDPLRVSSTDNRITACGAQWEKNLGPQGFALPKHIKMPTLKWAPANESDPYIGGAFATQNTNSNRDADHESCSLNYQETAYTNTVPGTFGTCPEEGNAACPATGYCANGDDCTPFSKLGHTGNTILAFRWIDVDGDHLVDLVASPVKGGLINYNLQRGAGISGHVYPESPGEPQIFGVFPPCTTSVTADPTGPYTMCNGTYPWIVFKNHGNGVFGTIGRNGQPFPTKILYEPIPLETSNGDSSINAAAIGGFQAYADLDGDGYPDGAVKVPNAPSLSWSVYRNDGTGQLQPAPAYQRSDLEFVFGEAYTMFGPAEAQFTALDTVQLGLSNVVSVQGLFDLSGDGLMDHWSSTGSGAQFDVNDGQDLGLYVSTQLSTALRPGTDGTPTSSVTVGSQIGGFSKYIAEGTRVDSSRTLDLDGDGRVDVVQFSPGTTLPNAYFNQGGQFGGPAGVVGDGAALIHTVVVTDQIPYSWMASAPETFAWEQRADMIDLDGDGIAEGVNFDDAIQPGDGGGTLYLSKVTTPTQPPRLLVGVHNHRGADTSISYAAMTNGSVVEQHPELHKAMPATQWVVQGVTTEDQLAHTVATSSYQYKNPQFSPDDRGSWGFRGFDEVLTTRPSGAQLIERFSFIPDWSGRLVTSMVKASAADPGVGIATIDDTTWEERDLFGGAVQTFHATASDHWTCPSNDGSTAGEMTCRGTAANRRHTVSILSALASTSNTSDSIPLLWQETESRLQAGDTFAEDDRTTTSTFTIHADQATYRVRPLVMTRQQLKSGSLVAFAKSARTWDPSDRVPITDEVWFDTDDTHRAITRRVYDLLTGNVLEVWKPKQNEAGTHRTVFTYDTSKLFVASEINELGHVQDYTYEPGTGTKLSTTGPNAATCASNSTCSVGTLTREQHRIRVDGLGRTIERYETFSDDGAAYTPYLVETLAYDDTAYDRLGIATSVAHLRALDVTGSTVAYADDLAEQDGLGRRSKQTVFVHGTAAANQTTTFQYRNDGTLATVNVPDPSNDANTVSYTYTFDSLGRPRSIRRPDAAASSDNGLDITYAGLLSTTREVVGAAGGQSASSTTVHDRFDRLVEVDEQLDLAPTFAATRYSYAADNDVSTVIDPEGVTTSLFHDLAGHRTQIARGARSWNYGYDKNGNMVSEQVPGAPNAAGALFITSIAYDDLDRVSSKSIGQRMLTAVDQASFASGTETYTYDLGSNRIGQLRYWKSFAPGATTPALTLDLGINAQGQRTSTTETLNVAGYPTLTRQLQRNYYIDGAVRSTFYGDSIGGINATASRINQDVRGLPSSVVLSRTGLSDLTLAVQTRNVAGLVTKRRSNVATAMGFIESNWTYDPLGRVTSQVVQKGSAPAQVVRQDLTYFGNDDPKTLDHWLGATNHKHYNFGYDLRHQLTGVTETAANGAFGATYSYGPAGRIQHAIESARALPGSEVKPRDVSYQYAVTDPEEVAALVSANGSVFTLYQYDEAGNQVFRCADGTKPNGKCKAAAIGMTYDGKDQLRRVTALKNGLVASLLTLVFDGSIDGTEEYWYDGFGQRIATVKRDKQSHKTELIWWLDDSEAHYDDVGNLVHIYSHLSLGTPVARVNRTSNTATQVEFQFHGLASSTVAAVAESGAINASFDYAPFGEIIESTNSGGATAGVNAHFRRVNDKFIDEVSDLTYYGVRYYDRYTMAWTQGDPLSRFLPDSTMASPRRANIYTFDLGNPVRYLDPDGRTPDVQHTRDVVVYSPHLWEIVNEIVPELEALAAESFSEGGVSGTGKGPETSPQIRPNTARKIPCCRTMWSNDFMSGASFSSPMYGMAS